MTRNGIRTIVWAACLGLGLIATGPQPANSQTDQWNALYDRMIRLEHEVRGLQAGGGGTAFPGVSADAGQGGERLGAIEDQLRRMLAQLEDIRRAQQALELRLDRLEGGTGTTGTIFDQPQVTPPYRYPAEFDLSQYQSRELAQLAGEQDVTIETYREDDPYPQAAPYRETAPGPQVLGTLRIPSVDEQPRYPATGTGESSGGSLVPEKVEQAALDGSPMPSTGRDGPTDSVFKSAYDSLLGRRFGDAEAGFKMFIDRNGNHPLAGDAQYWLGETYYVQGDYKEAAQSFLKGYRTYPESRKAPDTLFKLALSLKQLEQTAQACSTFAEVAKKYPTAAEIRNEALKEMSRAGC